MAKKGFEFQFKNPVQDSGDALTNVVFINDTPSESDILRLELTTVPDVSLTLKPVDSDQASDSNYHFKLTCHPDTLALPEQILLDASHSALWAMVCIPETTASADGERAPGDIDFYVLYKGDTALEVTPDAPLSLTLRKVGAASSGGTRPTITQVTLNKKETDFDRFVVLAGPGGDYNLTESTGLVLIAPRGQSAPTLMAGFASSDIVLNDGDTESYLLLRIVNTGLLPISLEHEGTPNPTKLTLRFEASDDTARLWALATRPQISSILIPGKPDSSATDPNWSGKDAWTVTTQASDRAWTLTPKAGKTSLAPNEAIEVPISKIVTGHATGRTPLRIRYAGLPGFDEGELVAYIQKYPLVYAGQKVGIGTDSPSEKLTVETAVREYGITHTDGAIKLSTRLTLAAGPPEVRTAGLGTRTNHDLFFYTNDSVSSPQMTLKTDGKVGIGTSEPSGKLTVQTTSEPLGTARGITHTNVAQTLSGPKTTTFSTRLGSEGAGLGTESDHPLRFFTNGGSAQVTLKTNGNLGIGTSDPSEKLTVKTNTDNDGITHTDGTVKLTTRVDAGSGLLGTRSNHKLSFFTNGTTKMTLTSNGRLGIGTATPSYPVELQAAESGAGFVHTHGSKKLSTFINDKGCWLGTLSNDHLNFFTNDSQPQMTLQTDGRLWLKTKPIEYWSGDVAYNQPATTSYSTREWLGVIAGFDCSSAPDPDNDKNAGFKCYADGSGTNWVIRVDLVNISCWWHVKAIFIRKDLVGGI